MKETQTEEAKKNRPSTAKQKGYGEADLSNDLDRSARVGLESLLTNLRNQGKTPDEDRYLERLELELGLIGELRCQNAFILTRDVVDEMRKYGIPVGPGRGAMTGSLVCYVLGITGLDPLEFSLFFERWLNPEMKVTPQFTLDVGSQGRERATELLHHRIGHPRNAEFGIQFLELTALDVIKDSVRRVRAGRDPNFIINEIPLTDSKTSELLSQGETEDIFMLDMDSTANVLVRCRPDCLGHVMACLSLNRPGPIDSGMLDEYLDRRHGRKPVSYLIPEVGPVLTETYGMPLYQEQVMQIAVEVSGCSYGQADLLRRDLGRKKSDAVASWRQAFVEGARKKGLTPEQAENVFQFLETSGEYAFNKGHSASYSLIAWRMAFLKAHYSQVFNQARAAFNSEKQKL